MKKFIVGFLCGAVMFSAIPVFAGSVYQKIEAFIRNDVKVVSNETQVKLSKPALSYNGGTYLYVRDIANVFDKNVGWNSASQTVEISDKALSSATENLNENTNSLKIESLKSPTILIDISDKLYSFGGGVILVSKDNAGKYYLQVAGVSVLNGLLKIANNNYEIKDSSNPYLGGELDFTNIQTNYMDYKMEYSSVNNKFYVFTFYNADKTKKYIISTKPDAKQGTIENQGTDYVPLETFFEALGVKAMFIEDKVNKTLVMSFE